MFKLAFLLVLIAFAQPSPHLWMTAFWGDLTFAYPSAWQPPLIEGDTLTLSDGATTIRARVVEGGDAVAALAAELDALGLLHFGFQPATIYGRPGWQVNAVTADRAAVGEGRAGYLPDDRLIIAAGRWTGDSTALDDFFASLSTSGAIVPSYQPVWTSAETGFEMVIAGATVYALEREAGLTLYDGVTGERLGQHPFEHVPQPTDMTIDDSGIVYIADVVCRCLLRFHEGAWIEPVGAFAGNAPLGVAVAPDGMIYAIDRYKDGSYALNIEGADDVIALNFNAAAPPVLLVDADGSPLVVEWLTSMLDGNVYGYMSAFSTMTMRAAGGQWLDFPPADVTMAADGSAVMAGASIQRRGRDGAWETILETGGQSAALYGDHLYVVDEGGALNAYRYQFPADRAGSPDVLTNAGVGYGVVSEQTPRQTWRYDGNAGETITISAVDPARGDPGVIGLDMALRVFDPNGVEIGYNDDQLGIDLYGAFDAHIPDLVLPVEGRYTLAVEWVQGSGSYLIGVRRDAAMTRDASGVIRAYGRLIDAAPVERWTFEGREGDVMTLTMRAQSGDLDPALDLLHPDGTRLAYNDDTPDPAMGVNAQINRVRLPVTGVYTVEASRFDGSGRYEVVILKVE